LKDYADFLASKTFLAPSQGVTVNPSDIHPMAFPFQRDLIKWSAQKGRACLFADAGLGKTGMQLEWARLIGEPTLILAPLAVVRQTVKEGDKWGVGVTYARSQKEADLSGITITNYEMLKHFDPAAFQSVVLDESGILKSMDGKTRTVLIEAFRETPYKLCCSATPAPNDIAELANHAEFMGIMSRVEMLATFFVHDDTGWRLKGHGRERFFEWLASWAMSLKKPSDLGYSDDGYELPPLSILPHIIPSDYVPDGQLFAAGLKGITDRAMVRRGTLDVRVKEAADLILSSSDPWCAWVGLNDEGEALHRLIPGSVLVEGAQTPEKKAESLERFADGDTRVLITKCSISGFGMNWQHCARTVFVGLSDSYEQYYQAIRRFYRFGQARPVEAHIVLTDLEEPIFHNVLKKEREAEQTSQELIRHVAEFERAEITATHRSTFMYETRTESGNGWKVMLGDSTERLREIEAESVHLSVFSPPFASLYTYSPTERDLGNSRSDEEFIRHFEFIISDLLRVTKPGRICACHVADVPAMLSRDGFIGLKDFSGEVIRAFVKSGWIFDSRIPIDKNQQAQSIRTHAKGLTMTQMEKDRTWSRPALPDYILKFRKPGENVLPVASGDVTRDLWIEWANPTWPGESDRCADSGAFATWYGIRETDTLNYKAARSEEDERHICPLQLETIERCIRLWSNEGETVLSPFAGVGSEGYEAIRLKRRFVGIELKPEYFNQAVKNIREVERKEQGGSLLSLLAEVA
jgi:hypothetical protein